MKIGFKQFLLNENRAYLAQKAGAILTALHDLDQNAQGMGTRNLVKNAEGVANQIRRILHTHWPKREEYNLKQMQKIAVSLMRAIDEKSDLETTIKSSVQELEKMMGNMDAPVNQLASPEGLNAPPDQPDSGVSEPEKPDQQKQQPAIPVPPGGAPGVPQPVDGATPPAPQQPVM